MSESGSAPIISNHAWQAGVRALSKQDLPYVEWAAARQVALDERTRARKLAQKNLHYKHEYKPGRCRG